MQTFTDIDTSFVPIGKLVKSGGLKACLDYYDSLGSDFSEQVRSMLVFDCVIYNEDRHFGNFGLLRNNHTGKLTAPAPIFDNGMSLFCFADNDEFANLSSYAKTRYPAYGYITFEQLCKEVIGPTQVKQLRRLIGFEFKRHPQLNFPEAHLNAIEKHFALRVPQLISLANKSKSQTKSNEYDLSY